MRFIFIILVLAYSSCVYDPPLKRLNIEGYTCGDTIDDGIKIIEIANKWISYGVISEFKKAEVWLFNNHIERILIDSLTLEEFAQWKTKISDIYKIEPFYSKDSLYSGLGMRVEHYYWFDSISRDRISLVRSLKDNPDSLSTLYFENIHIAETYREYIFGPQEEFEFIEEEDDSN